MKSAVCLSQCMIVKNEEKNIRRALSWGKGIAFEQIVVDTGSTDRTVEIAEEMGAAVYYFPWIQDFSAAKNFAIEKASGNWIAFLDADEYFLPEDAEKILPLLNRLEKNLSASKRPHIIRTALANLNDEGGVSTVGTQDKIFRNIPSLRYRNRIHETLWGPENIRFIAYNAVKELCILHTGYTFLAYQETNKRERNVRLLEETVLDEPENSVAWSYLGDGYLAWGDLEKAENAYERALKNQDERLQKTRRDLALCGLLKISYYKGDVPKEKFLALYEKSRAAACELPDAEYWTGMGLLKKGELKQGSDMLKASLEKMEHYSGAGVSEAAGALSIIYQSLCGAAMELSDPAEAVKYGVLALRLDPHLEPVLQSLLTLLKKEPGEEDTATGTFQLLCNLYHFTTFKDKLLVIKASRAVGFSALEKQVVQLFTREEREFFYSRVRSGEQEVETLGDRGGLKGQKYKKDEK